MMAYGSHVVGIYVTPISATELIEKKGVSLVTGSLSPILGHHTHERDLLFKI